MKPTLQILVSPTGEFTIEGIGFTGSDCEQATRFLEQALGSVQQRRKKPEFHQSARTTPQQTLGR